MIRTGLVSVTFRKIGVQDVIRLTKEAGLRHIEWGGDVHVPPGKIDLARDVGKRTLDAGLELAAYGSYFRVGADSENEASLGQTLETARALGTSIVRVWAGSRGSKGAPESYWRKMITDTQEAADFAQREGMSLAFEFHGNTLNDATSATRRLMEQVERDNVATYWQEDNRVDYDTCLKGLKRIRKWLSNIHVFHWHEGKRRPLDEAESKWEMYLDMAASSEQDHIALIEFVQEDSPLLFVNDAATLKRIVKRVNKRLKEGEE